LGAVSYAAATPGGLFAPMLVLGAQLESFYGAVCRLAFPDLGIEPEAFAVVGMAAFFTGVVQAPVTGIVLVIEMTAGFTTLLPMLGACFAAILMPNLSHSAPIYKSLREHAARRQGSAPDAGRVQSRDHWANRRAAEISRAFYIEIAGLDFWHSHCARSH
jgi:CIC family chloride channel protein